MNMSPKVSVIVPVHNAEKYLDESIGSLVNQTLADIEIICVDDASTDGSLKKLNELSANDNRIKVYSYSVSKSALGARKTGVQNATGEYVMFLDADDYFSLDACELAYNKIEEKQVDIVHFNTEIINLGNTAESEIDKLKKAIRPHIGELKGNEVFQSCFFRKEYAHNPVNKIYKTSLCKKAYEMTEDKYFIYAEDLYVYFIIAYYAKSYYGWESKPMYHYCYGRGLSGNENFSIDKFKKLCSHADVLKSLEKFKNDNNLAIDNYDSIISSYKNEWFNYCIYVWNNGLDTNCLADGIDLLCSYWGNEDSIAAIADRYWADRHILAKRIGKLNDTPISDKNIKTIAFHYYRYSIGGVERVISILTPMFIKMGYNVVLITEEEPTENDFSLPEGVKRIVIENSAKPNFKNRVKCWKKIVEENNIDLVLYSAWEFAIFFWDMLYLKSIGTSVVMHTHGVFTSSLVKLKKAFGIIPDTYRLADAVVTLSNVDKIFWEAFNDKVHYIPNPVSEDLFNANSAKWSNKSIVWAGRVDPPKNPEAPFDIMKRVVKCIPDAKLTLLGDFYDTKWKEIARKYNIEKNIVFEGFVSNVNHYFENSSVFLMTSTSEGFPMVLLEAQAHSLPTVMFSLPYLEMGKKECGVVNVDMKDCNRAADEIIKLLQDEEHWNIQSSLAKDSVSRFTSFDYEKAWNDVFKGVTPDTNNNNPFVRDMIYTFINDYQKGIEFSEKINPPESILEAAERFINVLRTKGIRYIIRMVVKKFI